MHLWPSLNNLENAHHFHRSLRKGNVPQRNTSLKIFAFLDNVSRSPALTISSANVLSKVKKSTKKM